MWTRHCVAAAVGPLSASRAVTLRAGNWLFMAILAAIIVNIE